MRAKLNNQPELNFQPSNLKVTNEYYEKYECVSRILEGNRRLLDLVHKDLKGPLEYASVKGKDGSVFRYSSDTVLRIAICQIMEGASLRQIVVRIDDSNYLRWFVGIYNGPMMDFTTFDKLKNSIRSETWRKVNKLLAQYAIDAGSISGEFLRMDTTAVETNVHYPTDSALLWDTYRVLGRLIEQAREIDAAAVGDRRLLKKKVKKLATKIARLSSKNPGQVAKLRPLYEQLIPLVEGICEWSASVCAALKTRIKNNSSGDVVKVIVEQMAHYRKLGIQVIYQASRRVLDGTPVPNEAKLFSIFEPHTELLMRGKAGKPIEFGHMIQIQQVQEKFITDYDVFDKRPVDYELIEPAIESHKKLFGAYPRTVAADKGYWENREAAEELREQIDLVSIAKKGQRTEEEAQREMDPMFRHAQRFRAGVEGTISFLKRILGMARCYNKGWEHYVCTIGATIFAHNLLILTRQ